MRSLLMLFAATALAAPAAAQTVTEPASGVAFPVELTGANGSHQVLAGTGLRTKTFLKVKIYAFGLYVDAAGARSGLSAFAGKTAVQLGTDNNFYDALLRQSFPMSLRLSMIRNITGEQMSDAFEEALRPRVVAAASRNMPGGEAALTSFRGYFSLDHLTEGVELIFTCTPDGTLHSSVAGEAKAPIASHALCWALFDVYLGRTPISPEGRKSVIGRMPGIIGG
jgi:hypothetical protein